MAEQKEREVQRGETNGAWPPSRQHSPEELASFGGAMGKWLDNARSPTDGLGRWAEGILRTGIVRASTSSEPKAQHNNTMSHWSPK